MSVLYMMLYINLVHIILVPILELTCALTLVALVMVRPPRGRQVVQIDHPISTRIIPSMLAWLVSGVFGQCSPKAIAVATHGTCSSRYRTSTVTLCGGRESGRSEVRSCGVGASCGILFVKGKSVNFFVVEILARIGRLVLENFDCVIKDGSNNGSDDGAQPIDPVVAGKLVQRDAGSKAASRVEGASSKVDASQLRDEKRQTNTNGSQVCSFVLFGR